MQRMRFSYRYIIGCTLSVLGVVGWFGAAGLSGQHRNFRGVAHAAALTVPEGAPGERFDFESGGIEGWKVVNGQWSVEEMQDAPSGTRVLVQRAVQNAFNVIVAPSGPYSEIDVSVRFKPMTGREDASGGIVFRFAERHYYVVRA